MDIFYIVELVLQIVVLIRGNTVFANNINYIHVCKGSITIFSILHQRNYHNNTTDKINLP